MATTSEDTKKPTIPNFSRPRQLLDNNLTPPSTSSSKDSIETVRHISAFKDSPTLPDEPRFSTDSQPTQRQETRPFQSQPSSSNEPSSSENTTPPSTSSSSNNPTKPLLKSILKSTTISQHSERASSSGEDTTSHHTVSEDSNEVGYIVEGKWSSSDADTSALSEKEVEKLEKKGINPSLYCEMKGARGMGGGRVGLGVGKLTGNAFV